MPAVKPAFVEFLPTMNGTFWLVRQGPGEPLDDCAENPIELGIEAARTSPCWRDTWIIDSFDGEGRYLGEIEPISIVGFARTTVFVRDSMVVAAVEDEAGTIMVKRYPLVPPEEGGRQGS